MKVAVAFLPRDVDPATLPGRSAVVFDVLRATTTITAALTTGVSEIRIFPDTDSAKVAAHSEKTRPILVGERQCLKPEGFDLGNSPTQFNSVSHTGKPLFMATTNGTRGIIAAKGAKLLLAGALVNRTAVAEVLVSAGQDITLICAGTNNQIALEDLLGAGAVLEALQSLAEIQFESDACKVVQTLFNQAKPHLHATLTQTTGGQNIIQAGLEEDITACAAIDSVTTVGWVVDQPLRVLRY